MKAWHNERLYYSRISTRPTRVEGSLGQFDESAVIVFAENDERAADAGIAEARKRGYETERVISTMCWGDAPWRQRLSKTT